MYFKVIYARLLLFRHAAPDGTQHHTAVLSCHNWSFRRLLNSVTRQTILYCDTDSLLTLLSDALRLRTPHALVLCATVAGRVHGHPGVWVASQLESVVLAGNLAAELICTGRGYC